MVALDKPWSFDTGLNPIFSDAFITDVGLARAYLRVLFVFQEECINRYRVLAELVKKRKQNLWLLHVTRRLTFDLPFFCALPLIIIGLYLLSFCQLCSDWICSSIKCFYFLPSEESQNIHTHTHTSWFWRFKSSASFHYIKSGLNKCLTTNSDKMSTYRVRLVWHESSVWLQVEAPQACWELRQLKCMDS